MAPRSIQPGRLSPGSDRALGIVAVCATLLGWTITPLLIRFFAEHIDAWTSNGWRYGFAAALWSPLLIVCFVRGKLPPGLWRAALIPAAFNGMAQVAFTWAHYLIEPGLLTFGMRSQIVFVAIGAALLFPAERRIIRTPGFIVGIGLVLAGTAGTVLFGEGIGQSATLFGVGLAFGAGAGFAAYAIAVRHCMHGIPSMVAFAAVSQFTALPMIAMMLVLGERGGVVALELSPRLFGLLLASAVIGIALGHVFYYISLVRLGVTVSSGVIQLQPFCVAALSVLFLGEHLNAGQWVCGGVAVLGAVGILMVQHRKRHGEPGAIADDLHEFEDLPPDHVAAAAVAESDRD